MRYARFALWFGGFTLIVLSGNWSSSRSAYGADDLICVEEDWELKVIAPDPNLQAPQVTTIISPSGDLDGIYAAFDLNHQSLPRFKGGGMQLQLWQGAAPQESQNADTNASLLHEGETVTWTTRMVVFEGYLAFQIRHGHSETWGDFGGEDFTTILETNLCNLNDYNTEVTLASSGIGFAANRVQSLKLNAVRYYGRNGLQYEDNSPHVLHQHPDE